ncbi:MAG: hypothetical protein KJT03_11320, partial [Verrucomicrobiae bacterium]|nr:hypothetical protein [Verrucomicrobiae bacterium]
MKGTFYLWMAVVLFPSMFVEAALSESPSLFVEGYSGQVSYVAGEKVALHVSTSAQVCSLEIARLGAQREVVMSRLEVPGKKYSVPENASSYGCNWPASYQFELPEDWTSGYYEVRLRVSDEGGDFQQRNRRTAEGQCYFIVRPQEPGTRTKILIQLSTNTYNAYNNWGDFSLYGYHGL